MREGAKKRLIGAVILVLLAVIFMPMLVEEEVFQREPDSVASIPEEPEFDSEFSATEVFLNPGEVPLAEEFEFRSEADNEYADTGSSEEESILPIEDPLKRVPVTAALPAPAPVAVARVEAPVTTAVGPVSLKGPGWVVQVASLSTASNAARHEKKLRGSGFPAFTEKANVGGRIWFRVRVGPEAKRQAASRLAARLKRSGYPDAFVKAYP